MRGAGQRQFLVRQLQRVRGAAGHQRQCLQHLDRRARKDLPLDVTQRPHAAAVGIEDREGAAVHRFHRAATIGFDKHRVRFHRYHCNAAVDNAVMSVLSESQLLGVDFTSAPTRRKPITVARGRLDGQVLRLESLDALASCAAFEAEIAKPGPWLGAFDFPFGLPRDVRPGARPWVIALRAVIAELQRRCADRMALRALVDAWGRPGRPGQRLLHRALDTRNARRRSTSPLQTRYVPVGFMYFEGLSRLVAAGVTLPGCTRATRRDWRSRAIRLCWRTS